MRVRYDPDVDVLTIRLSDAPIADSESVEPNLVLDRDAEDNIVGIEVLWVSRLPGSEPMTLAFEVVNAVAARPAVGGEAAEAKAAE